MDAPLESDIQRACLDLLRLVGALPIRVNSAGVKVEGRFFRANSEPGCSDIIACLPDGRFLACEVKRPGGKVTALQRSFLDRVTAAGGLALVVRSLDELRAALTAEGITA